MLENRGYDYLIGLISHVFPSSRSKPFHHHAMPPFNCHEPRWAPQKWTFKKKMKSEPDVGYLYRCFKHELFSKL